MGWDVQGERQAAFRIVYDATRGPLIAYALRRTLDPEDAADVVAEVFLIAWRRFDAVPRDERALLWMYATARRVLANRLRKIETRSKVVDRLRLQLEGVGTNVVDHDEALAARDALKGLSDDDREVLILAGWEGLNSAELACVLGCSVTAVRLRLHRARARLRASEERGGDRADSAKEPLPPRESIREVEKA